jgi:hypothetical protein
MIVYNSAVVHSEKMGSPGMLVPYYNKMTVTVIRYSLMALLMLYAFLLLTMPHYHS